MNLSTFLRDEAGATAIEYALICSGIFLVIITAVTAFATGATNMFNTLSSKMGAPN